MKKISCFCLLGILMLSSRAQESTKTIEELNLKIEKIFSKTKLPGLTIIAVNNERVLYEKSLGFADVELQKKYSSQTIQNIGSISKTVIALAIMKAVEQGKVDLDKDINKYLPFKIEHPKYKNSPITLRHLANHTSGIIDDYVYDKSYVLLNPDDESLLRLPKKIQKYLGDIKENKGIDDSEFILNSLTKEGKWYSEKNFTKKEPGQLSEYSNIGSALAAFVIECAVGMSFESYTEKHIFKPLKMTNTSWHIENLTISDHAKRYFPNNIKVPDYDLITYADGGLITNAMDFGKYLTEMIKGYNGKGFLLRNDLYKEMFTRREIGKEHGGIFWSIDEDGNPSHNGADPGVLTNTEFKPKENLGIFIMTNVSADMDKNLIKPMIKIWRLVENHNWE